MSQQLQAANFALGTSSGALAGVLLSFLVAEGVDPATMCIMFLVGALVGGVIGWKWSK